MDEKTLQGIVEAFLLSHTRPLSLEKIQDLFAEAGHTTSKSQLQLVMSQLQAEYRCRAFELVAVAGGYVLQTKPQYAPWIARLLQEKPTKYSQALLETLAIVAYKQPVTRSDIEALRGVAVSSYIMKTLLEREWIRVVGYKDVPGKPAIYCTTKEFLHYFNLTDLQALPKIGQALEGVV